MGQQRDAVNADPVFKQRVATLSGRPPLFNAAAMMRVAENILSWVAQIDHSLH